MLETPGVPETAVMDPEIPGVDLENLEIPGVESEGMEPPGMEPEDTGVGLKIPGVAEESPIPGVPIELPGVLSEECGDNSQPTKTLTPMTTAKGHPRHCHPGPRTPAITQTATTKTKTMNTTRKYRMTRYTTPTP
jgi:hypothetical protein